jgi:hypothetical protein
MCTDAISLGDGRFNQFNVYRELFVIKMDFTIRSFVDNYCMVVEDGEIKDRMPVILEDETNINDDRNMWKFAGHGAIKWFKDETMCMAYAVILNENHRKMIRKILLNMMGIHVMPVLMWKTVIKL